MKIPASARYVLESEYTVDHEDFWRPVAFFGDEQAANDYMEAKIERQLAERPIYRRRMRVVSISDFLSSFS